MKEFIYHPPSFVLAIRQLLYDCERFGDMPSRRKLSVKHMPNYTLFINDIGNAARKNAPCLGNAEKSPQRAIGVADQVKWQSLLLREGAVAFQRIVADSDNHRSGFHEIFVGIAEAAGLSGADARVVARIKIDNRRLPAANCDKEICSPECVTASKWGKRSPG